MSRDTICQMLAGLTLAGILTGCRLPSSFPQNLSTGHRSKAGLPLIQLRTMQQFAAKIKPENVRRLRFYGANFAGYDGYSKLDITDPDLVLHFLKALREAEGYDYALGNRSDNMDIELITPVNEEGNILRLNFLGFSAEEALGWEFVKALEELECFEARQLRQEVASYSGNVTKIVLISGYTVTITKSAKIQEVLDALQQVDSRAFAFTHDNCPLEVRLHLKDGTVKEYKLAVGPYDYRHPPSQPMPILPSPLWEYFLQTQGKKP